MKLLSLISLILIFITVYSVKGYEYDEGEDDEHSEYDHVQENQAQQQQQQQQGGVDLETFNKVMELTSDECKAEVAQAEHNGGQFSDECKREMQMNYQRIVGGNTQQPKPTDVNEEGRPAKKSPGDSTSTIYGITGFLIALAIAGISTSWYFYSDWESKMGNRPAKKDKKKQKKTKF